jgi:hypothetical protein
MFCTVATAIASTCGCGACSSSALPDGGAATLPSSGNYLAGPHAFVVRDGALDTRFVGGRRLAEATPHDGSNEVVAIVLAAGDRATLCAALGSSFETTTTLVDPALLIRLIGNTNADTRTGLPRLSVAPGDYEVAFDGAADDDGAARLMRGGAFVDLLRLGGPEAGRAPPQAAAISGHVTITMVTPDRVVGTFHVQLGDYDGGIGSIDTENPSPLEGSFDVSRCSVGSEP